MAVVVMSRCEHSNQIDSKSKTADNEELICVHVGWIDESLYRFKDDKDRNEDEKDAVCESREGFYTSVADGIRN